MRTSNGEVSFIKRPLHANGLFSFTKPKELLPPYVSYFLYASVPLHELTKEHCRSVAVLMLIYPREFITVQLTSQHFFLPGSPDTDLYFVSE